MSEPRTLMKDGLGPAAVARLEKGLGAVLAGSRGAEFRRRALAGLEDLELKQRVDHIVAVLVDLLPSVSEVLPVLPQVRDAWPAGDPEDALAGFAAWPFLEWVAARGLDEPEASFEALRILTSLFTGEFAIRPFLDQDPVLALEILRGWTSDEDEHVRRLVSEGTRPRLPWAPRLRVFGRDVEPVLELLERLCDDPSEMVRRSVANHLNDLAKDDPERVIGLARAWMEDASEERGRLVRHALRTLVKGGSPGALEILGFTIDPRIEATLALRPTVLRLGGMLEIDVTLRSGSPDLQRLVVDYAVDFVKARGTSEKVFKLRNVDLEPGATIQWTKRHRMAPATTRRYYGGVHRVTLIVSGRRVLQGEFELEVPGVVS